MYEHVYNVTTQLIRIIGLCTSVTNMGIESPRPTMVVNKRKLTSLQLSD